MNNATCVVLGQQAADKVCLNAAADTFLIALAVVHPLCHAHSIVAAELVGALKGRVELIAEHGIMLFIDSGAIKIGLQRLLLLNGVHIHAFTVTQRIAGLGGVISHRILVAVIVHHLAANGGQLPQGVTVAGHIHHQRVHGRPVVAHREDRAAPNLGDRVNNGVIARFQRGLCYRHKILRRGDRGDRFLTGCLFNDIGQNGRRLGKGHAIHIVFTSLLFLPVLLRRGDNT